MGEIRLLERPAEQSPQIAEPCQEMSLSQIYCARSKRFVSLHAISFLISYYTQMGIFIASGSGMHMVQQGSKTASLKLELTAQRKI